MYDLIIIGGGAAGITAAIYAARYKLKTLLITKEIGGTALEAHNIENWPGEFGISGAALMKKFKDHLKKFDVDIIEDEAVRLEKGFQVTIKKGKKFRTKTIILALGTKRRKLNIKGEDNFANGKGISYCYTCDGPLFKNKTVAVVGGSDSSVQAALLLSSYAKKTYVIYRGEKLRAEPMAVEQLQKKSNVKIIYKANVVGALGDNFLNRIKLDDGKGLAIEGLFIEIGAVPSIDLAKQLNVELDDHGYIKVDAGMATNIPGVYAAGDVVARRLKQLVVSASDGAIAATSAYNNIKGQNF